MTPEKIIIRDDERRKVVVLPGGIQVWDPESGACTAAALNPNERKAMAAALDPDREMPEQWRTLADRADRLTTERDEAAGRALYHKNMVETLNSKLASIARDHEQDIERLRASYAERLNEANGRAEALTADRDRTMRAYQTVNRRARNASALIALAEAKVRELVKADDLPEVTTDDLELIISGGLFHREVTPEVVAAIARDIYYELHPENKPPAPHPVEALAEELFKVGHPEFGSEWSNVLEHIRDVYRLIARHHLDAQEG